MGNAGKITKLKVKSKLILNILSYCDGTNSIEEISNKCGVRFLHCKNILHFLKNKNLVKII